MKVYPTPLEALQECLDIAGSYSQMARDLGVTQPTTWRWVNEAEKIAPDRVLLAEKTYGVSRHSLRPDYYPIKKRRARKAVGA